MRQENVVCMPLQGASTSQLKEEPSISITFPLQLH